MKTLTKTKNIIKKWYQTLEFPSKFDNEFQQGLSSIYIDDKTTVENYDFTCEDGLKNLLSFLYMCETTFLTLTQKSIPQNVIINTLKDIVYWTNTWSEIKGSLYLGEIFWLRRHLKGRIFRLGRLQFAFGTLDKDYPDFQIKNNEQVIEIHIPSGDRLSKEEIDNSFDLAKDFFATFFPNYEYKYFTCHSWLLDETLNNFLKPTSNIILFANRFTILEKKPSYAILKFTFTWDTTKENLSTKTPTTKLNECIQSAVLNDTKFYEPLGFIKIKQ